MSDDLSWPKTCGQMSETNHTTKPQSSSRFKMKRSQSLAAFTLLTSLACLAFPAEASELVLRYEQPAARWQQEALPIGNGHMGAMLFGGIQREQIQFNEESLWVGDEEDTGAYQAFGDVFVQFDSAARSSGVNQAPPAAAEVSDYRRQLDIERAVHTVTFAKAAIKYRREAFASYPAKVIVYRFTADKPASLTGSVSMTDMHKAAIRATNDTIISCWFARRLRICKTSTSC